MNQIEWSLIQQRLGGRWPLRSLSPLNGSGEHVRFLWFQRERLGCLSLLYNLYAQWTSGLVLFCFVFYSNAILKTWGWVRSDTSASWVAKHALKQVVHLPTGRSSLWHLNVLFCLRLPPGSLGCSRRPSSQGSQGYCKSPAAPVLGPVTLLVAEAPSIYRCRGWKAARERNSRTDWPCLLIPPLYCCPVWFLLCPRQEDGCPILVGWNPTTTEHLTDLLAIYFTNRYK
jgi:hypothetical protein